MNASYSAAYRTFWVVALCIFLGHCAEAQAPQYGNVTNLTSTPKEGIGHDYIKALAETVNPANGSLSVRIAAPTPLFRHGAPPLYMFMYDTDGIFVPQVNAADSPDNSVTASGAPSGHLIVGPMSVVVDPSRAGATNTVPNIGTSRNVSISRYRGATNTTQNCNYNGDFTYTDYEGHRTALNLLLYTQTTNDCGSLGASQVTSTVTPNLVAATDPTQSSSGGMVFTGPNGGHIGSVDANGNSLMHPFYAGTDDAGQAISFNYGSTGSYGGTYQPQSATVPGVAGAYQYAYTTLKTTGVPLQSSVTGSGCLTNASITGFSGTLTVLHTLTLPNGQSYTFDYDPASGMLSRITYPTGAKVEYVWTVVPQTETTGFFDATSYYQFGGPNCYYQHDWIGIQSRTVYFDGVHAALKQTFAYTTNWNNGTQQWTSKTTTVTTQDFLATDMNATSVVYQYSPAPGFSNTTPNNPTWSSAPPVEASISYRNSAGKALQTVSKVWDTPEILGAQCTTTDNGSTSGLFYKHLLYGSTQYPATTEVNVITDVAEFGFGTGVTSACTRPGGTPTRETAYTFASFSNPAWFPNNPYMYGKPSTVKVYDNGQLASETDLSYDETAVSGVSPTPNNFYTIANNASLTGPRGNLTSVKRVCFFGPSSNLCNSLLSSIKYDETGQATSVTNGSLTTNISHADQWAAGTGSPSGSSNALTTQISQGSLVQRFDYDYAHEALRDSTDENSRVTTYTYNDVWGRPTLVSKPDGGSTTIQYSDAGPNPSVTTTTAKDSSSSITATTTMDGMHHAIGTTLTAPEGKIQTGTPVDGHGRIASISNPAVGSSTGAVTKAYDALDRLVTQTNQDGSSTTISYSDTVAGTSGSVHTITDERGTQSQQVFDWDSRLIAVIEDSASSKIPTTYTYDALGNLLTAKQMGIGSETSRALRYFAYDSLSRLIYGTNPETGTVCYGVWTGSSPGQGNCVGGYDANGNLLAVTNANGKGSKYAYDALNRMTGKTYFSPSGTNNFWVKSYYYDGQRADGAAAASGGNQVGRLSSTRSWAPYGNGWHDEYQSYDAMGRVAGRTEVSQSESGTGGHTITMGYDLAGNMNLLTYPDGRLIRPAYDGAGRLSSITDGDGTSYLSSVAYFPNGTPQLSITTNVLAQQYSLNSRLQLCDSSFGNQFGTLMSRQYFFGSNTSSGQQCSPAAGNNGNIYHVLDALNPVNSQHYAYDSLNRLTQWSGSSPAGVFRQQSFGYDSFGNLTQASGGTPLAASSVYGSNNRYLPNQFNCTGVNGEMGGYDANGNVLCTGVQNATAQAYAYNEENQLVLAYAEPNCNAYALRALYSYDSSGQRIRSDQYNVGCGQTDPGSYPNGHPNWREYTYWNGNVLAEKDQDGVWTDYIYGNGRKIAMAPRQEKALLINGSYSGGWRGVSYTIPAPALQNYVFRAGDVLLVRQRKYGSNVHGGILIFANNNTVAAGAADQDGQPAGDDTLGGSGWHNRRIPLDSIAGQAYSGIWFGGGFSTDYNFQFASISVSSTDGTVRTVFNGEAESPTYVNGPVGSASAYIPVTTDGNSIRFYAQDQVGTAQMEVSAAGYPLWKGEFSPFGLEADPNPTGNRYKFTGKERDSESGLDYFPARYYGSNMGRWMSPDPIPWLGWQHPPEGSSEEEEEESHKKFEDWIGNPQNLNMYAYVNNNPLRYTDPTGMAGCQAGDKKFETCTITITYDKKTSKGTLTVTGMNKGDKGPTELLKTDVVVGGDGHVTPTGTFTASRWEKDHVSKLYGSSADTPWSKTVLGGNAFGPFQLHIKELDGRGIMIHGTMGPGMSPVTWGSSIFLSPTSHGCIRMCNSADINLHNMMPNPSGNKIIIGTTP